MSKPLWNKFLSVFNSSNTFSFLPFLTLYQLTPIFFSYYFNIFQSLFSLNLFLIPLTNPTSNFYLLLLHHLHFIISTPILKSPMMPLSIFTSTHMISTLKPCFHTPKLMNSHPRFSKISISLILTDSSWILILEISHCIFHSFIN